jgi:fermentation-respiration switch protein FrsA (DUF1100 family)
VRGVLLTAGIVLLILYLYAQIVRRTSMFYPSRYPVGNWNAESYAVHPQEIAFRSDHHTLHGWLFEGSPAAGRPSMIWFHGNAGNITDRAPMAAEFARRGISALLFDWRGYGKSEGTPTESGLYHDALAATDFLLQARGGGEIVAYGESLGGPYAAYVAAHRQVRCVVIENSMPSLAAMASALYRPFPMGIFVPWALTTTRWLNRAGVPVLVMHGKRDPVIPFELGQQLYEGLHVPKTMFVSETAGHCEIATAEPERYYDTVVRFIASPTSQTR